MIDLAAHLSTNLTLGEVLRTSHPEFRAEQETPPLEVLAALRRHAVDLWQPARDLVGRLRLSSGWRCPGLNAAVGGQPNSAHMRGDATDNQALDMPTIDAFLRIARSALQFDKVIFETDSRGREGLVYWIHLQSPRHWHAPVRDVLMKLPGRGFERFRESDPDFLALRKGIER